MENSFSFLLMYKLLIFTLTMMLARGCCRPKFLEEGDAYRISAYKLANHGLNSMLTADTAWVCQEDPLDPWHHINRRFPNVSTHSYSMAVSLLVVENLSDKEMLIDNCYGANWELIVQGGGAQQRVPMLG